jgi:NAD(P)-dependent dehydrogenase (short-subunit alcohol dehydrogenase family)
VTSAAWTPDDLPDLTGLRCVVTGANSGLGFHTALELTRHGAQVVLACRDAARGDGALARIQAQVPGAAAQVRPLDLADLASVRRFAAGLTADDGRLDVLVNNAGVMAVPRRATADGFELQFGTNHLGHFALTGLLQPALLRGSVLGGPARVVTVSSMLHRRGRLNRDDLMGERSYRRWRAYGQAKLANLLFTYELQRRADRAGPALAALAAHPGYADTNLQQVAPSLSGGLRGRVESGFSALGNRLFAQPAAQGAWPSLRAAGDPEARGGEFYGPGGFAEQRGHPKVVTASAAARDEDDARWLWERSVELTAVTYTELETTPHT